MSYRILVATDFSPIAETAVGYACRLARDFQAPLTLLHAFVIPVTFSDTPMPVMPLDEGRTIAEERLQAIVADLHREFPEIEIERKVMFGDITDCLEEYMEIEKPWMVILGNSGTAEQALWLGSNVLAVLKNLKNTVMAIPPEVSYRKPEKICFACDFKNIADHLQTEDLMQLASRTGAQLHVLNVDYQNKNYSTNTLPESPELHAMLAPLNPVYHFVEKENVEEGIQEFITANQMDWLVIVPHKYSFLESLFHKSHTKAIMKKVHIPLIAMHEK